MSEYTHTLTQSTSFIHLCHLHFFDNPFSPLAVLLYWSHSGKDVIIYTLLVKQCKEYGAVTKTTQSSYWCHKQRMKYGLCSKKYSCLDFWEAIWDFFLIAFCSYFLFLERALSFIISDCDTTTLIICHIDTEYFFLCNCWIINPDAAFTVVGVFSWSGTCSFFI